MAVSDDNTTILILFSGQQHIFQFDRAIDICSQARAQNFSSVEAKVVAHWNFKSPKMSNDDDKRSNYGLMNALRRTKAIFADFSKSPK